MSIQDELSKLAEKVHIMERRQDVMERIQMEHTEHIAANTKTLDTINKRFILIVGVVAGAGAMAGDTLINLVKSILM
jgi:hypothetical protein